MLSTTGTKPYDLNDKMPEDAFDLITLFDQWFKCYKVIRFEAGERAAVTKVIRCTVMR